MPLISSGNIYGFCGGTLAQAAGRSLWISRPGQREIQLEAEVAVEWLKVSPDGISVLVYGDRGKLVWRWHESLGFELFAAAKTSRDIPGCDFIKLDRSVLVTVCEDGLLRAFSDDGKQRFATNLKSPHSFYAREVVQLPGARVALVGSFFSDYCDAVVTVGLDEIVRNPEAVQESIRRKPPVWDRAPDITVGPCNPDAAVVLRHSEDVESLEDEEEIESLGGVGNFSGAYIRNLTTGSLIERHVYSGRAGTGAPILATDNWIAVQVIGGIDMISRKCSSVHHVQEAVLDVAGIQLARIQHRQIKELIPILTYQPK